MPQIFLKYLKDQLNKDSNLKKGNVIKKITDKSLILMSRFSNSNIKNLKKIDKINKKVFKSSLTRLLGLIPKLIMLIRKLMI